jgi:hypothetical protein
MKGEDMAVSCFKTDNAAGMPNGKVVRPVVRNEPLRLTPRRAEHDLSNTMGVGHTAFRDL